MITNYWNQGSASHHVDLRKEFDSLVLGVGEEHRHGYPMIIRHMRRDANRDRISCACKDKLTNSVDPFCSYCDGEGFLWDEVWYLGRSQFGGGAPLRAHHAGGPGEIRTDYKIFFFRYDVPLRYGDRIIEAELDLEGNVMQPLRRVSLHRPESIDVLRARDGRAEYIAAYCQEKSSIRSDS